MHHVNELQRLLVQNLPYSNANSEPKVFLQLVDVMHSYS